MVGDYILSDKVKAEIEILIKSYKVHVPLYNTAKYVFFGLREKENLNVPTMSTFRIYINSSSGLQRKTVII